MVATKMASGNVQYLILRPNGDVRFGFVQPSADVTNINTNVNGGSTGATRTLAYTQDQFPNDFPLTFIEPA